MQKFLILYIISIILLLSGCSVYKVDVRQGNFVTQEMLNQLELNMPAKKVRFIMGTPLMVDVFHQQRWDYLYSFQAGGKERRQRRITLFFDENQLLKKIEGDIKMGQWGKQRPTPQLDEFRLEPIL